MSEGLRSHCGWFKKQYIAFGVSLLGFIIILVAAPTEETEGSCNGTGCFGDDYCCVDGSGVCSNGGCYCSEQGSGGDNWWCDYPEPSQKLRTGGIVFLWIFLIASIASAIVLCCAISNDGWQCAGSNRTTSAGVANGGSDGSALEVDKGNAHSEKKKEDQKDDTSNIDDSGSEDAVAQNIEEEVDEA